MVDLMAMGLHFTMILRAACAVFYWARGLFCLENDDFWPLRAGWGGLIIPVSKAGDFGRRGREGYAKDAKEDRGKEKTK
jgi:hypothetical protein